MQFNPWHLPRTCIIWLPLQHEKVNHSCYVLDSKLFFATSKPRGENQNTHVSSPIHILYTFWTSSSPMMPFVESWPKCPFEIFVINSNIMLGKIDFQPCLVPAANQKRKKKGRHHNCISIIRSHHMTQTRQQQQHIRLRRLRSVDHFFTLMTPWSTDSHLGWSGCFAILIYSSDFKTMQRSTTAIAEGNPIDVQDLKPLADCEGLKRTC